MPTITPNPAGFEFNVEKDTKTPPGTPSSILPLVVIGYCTDTTNAPIAEPVPVSEPSAAQAAGGRGPAVELAAGALDPNGQVSLVHLVNVSASNAATYGAITQDWANALPPVAEADSVILPDDDFDVSILWTVGGTVGTAGAKYRVSVDGGIHYFAEQALGTATSVTVPFGGGKINLNPPEAEYIAYVADLRAQTIDHFALTSGGVHGAADTGPYTIDSAPTTVIEANTVLIQLITAASLHVVKTSGSVHGAADSTALAALAAIGLDETDQQWYRTAALAYKAAMFGTGTANSGHTIRTTSSIHGAADSTNTITTATPPAGTITADDSITFSTNAPTPDATEIAAAMQALRTYTGEFGTIVFASPISPSYISTIQAELVELWKRNKFLNVVAFFRRPNIGETTTAYRTALEALDGIVCVDVAMCSGAVYHQSALINTKDGLATPRRPQWWVAMAAARGEPEDCVQFATPQNGVRIRDSRGKILPGCLDEASGELYSVGARTIGTKTDAVRDPNGGVFVTQDLVLYDSNSDWILRPYSAVVNHSLRVGAPVAVFSSTPPNGFPSPPAEPLDAESSASIKADVDAVLQPEMVGKRRCSQVAFALVESTAATLRYKVTVVPNFYAINGLSLKASVSLVRVV